MSLYQYAKEGEDGGGGGRSICWWMENEDF